MLALAFQFYFLLVICYHCFTFHFAPISLALLYFSLHSYNLSVNGDVEKDEENEGEDTVDKEVEVDEIQFDIEGIDSKRSRSNAFYLKLAIVKMQNKNKNKITRATLIKEDPLQSMKTSKIFVPFRRSVSSISSRGASSHKV